MEYEVPTSEQTGATSASVVDPAPTSPTSPTRKPVPPLELQHRVADTSDPEVFLANGHKTALELEASLASAGRRLDSFERILDFGCGPGRVLLWLEQLAGRAELHGTDIDARAIEWVQANLAYVRADCNQALPPLKYPDGHFDLVFSHSVFTHIDEDYQDRWLAELQRVTRPGGLVLASVHGETVFNHAVEDVRRVGQDPSAWIDALSRDGILFVANDAWVGGPFPDFYHSTFHCPWYVFAHWGRYFLVRSYLARSSLGYQDWVLLERPVDGSALPPPLVQRIDPTGVAAGAPAAGGDQSGAASTGAIDRVASLLGTGHDRERSTRYGTAGRAARQLVARALSGHIRHQDRVNGAVVEALREEAALRAAGDQSLHDRLPGGGGAPIALDPLTAEIFKRQGERINRLEHDLRESLKR